MWLGVELGVDLRLDHLDLQAPIPGQVQHPAWLGLPLISPDFKPDIADISRRSIFTRGRGGTSVMARSHRGDLRLGAGEDAS